MRTFTTLKTLSAGCGLALAFLAGCGGGESTGSGPGAGGGGAVASGGSAGAGTGGAGGANTGGAGGSGTGGSAGAGGSGGVICAAGSICLEVAMIPGQTAPTAAGRLGVVWVDGSDLGNSAKWQVAYDTSFGPSVTQYAIPLSGISAPSPGLAYCGSSGCSGSAPQVFLGTIVAVRDANKNGAIDIDSEVAIAEKIGIAHGIVVNSPTDHGSPPTPLDPLFGGAIKGGTHVYALGTTSPVKLVPSDASQPIVLNACGATDTACGASPEIPNPFANLSL